MPPSPQCHVIPDEEFTSRRLSGALRLATDSNVFSISASSVRIFASILTAASPARAIPNYQRPSAHHHHHGASMLEIHCTGTPYEIGQQHGRAAKAQVHGSIAFYAAHFAATAGLDWPQACRVAATQFAATIAARWPAYLEELRGVADGAGVALDAVLALNVRTEIAFGLLRDDAPMDGCTTLAWRVPSSSGGGAGASWLAQNWDWSEPQKDQLVCLSIVQPGKPAIKMVTEAGIIGKIGMNEHGVGCCLNAIKARGIDGTRMPVHLALRTVLESSSAKEAEAKLREVGVASACSIGIADAEEGGFALECSYKGFGKVERDQKGRMVHSNHWLIKQDGVTDLTSPGDTLVRVVRIKELADEIKGEPSFEKLFDIFKDEKGHPGSICRSVGGSSTSATLFNIVMELKSRRAMVSLGKPTKPDETFWLEFTPN